MAQYNEVTLSDADIDRAVKTLADMIGSKSAQESANWILYLVEQVQIVQAGIGKANSVVNINGLVNLLRSNVNLLGD